jgi:hypothetical protein
MSFADRLRRGFRVLLSEPDEGPEPIELDAHTVAEVWNAFRIIGKPESTLIRKPKHGLAQRQKRIEQRRKEKIERQRIELFLTDTGVAGYLRELAELQADVKLRTGRVRALTARQQLVMRRLTFGVLIANSRPLVLRCEINHPPAVWIGVHFRSINRKLTEIKLQQRDMIKRFTILCDAIEFYSQDSAEAAQWLLTMATQNRIRCTREEFKAALRTIYETRMRGCADD